MNIFRIFAEKFISSEERDITGNKKRDVLSFLIERCIMERMLRMSELGSAISNRWESITRKHI